MKIKETSLKMESESPAGGDLVHLPLLAAYITNRNKEDRNYSDKGGHFFPLEFHLLLSIEGSSFPATMHEPPLAVDKKLPRP